MQMALLERVNDVIINMLINDLSEYLADRLGIDSIQVSYIMRDYIGNLPSPSPSSSSSLLFSSSKNSIKTNITGVKICKVLKNGKKCGTHIRGPGRYCSKHRKNS